VAHFSLGFKLKDFLRENETLSMFLLQNASIDPNYVKNILEADVNLEKVSIEKHYFEGLKNNNNGDHKITFLFNAFI